MRLQVQCIIRHYLDLIRVCIDDFEREKKMGKNDTLLNFVIKIARVNAHGGNYGNTLQAASINGREEVMQMQLKHDLDVNAPGGHHGKALQAASWKGHMQV